MDFLTQNKIDLASVVDTMTMSILWSDNRILSLFISKALPELFPGQIYAAERDRINVEGATVSIRTANRSGRYNYYPSYQKGYGRHTDDLAARKNTDDLDFFLCIYKLEFGVIGYMLVAASEVDFEEAL